MRVLVIGFLSWALSRAVCGYAAFTLTWGIPATGIDANPPFGDTDLQPRVAVDAAGNAVAVWSRTQSQGALEDVWAAQYVHATRMWTGAVKVSGGANSAHPAIAMSDEGLAVLVWEEGFPSQIRSRTLSGGIWMPPLALSPSVVCKKPYAQVGPQVAMDGTGAAVALWEEVVAGTHQIHSAGKPFGADWRSLGILSSGQTSATLSPTHSLALNRSGEGIAVWEENKGTIWASRLLHSTWMRPFPLSLGCGEAHHPSVGIDSQGNAVIVWSWAHAVVLSKTLIQGELSPLPLTVSNPAWTSKHPCVQVDGAGNALAVFERHDVGSDGVPKHQFIASAHLPFGGAAWSSPVDISGPSLSPHGSSRAGYPALTANPIGDAVAIWKEYNGRTFTVQGAGYSMGTWSLFQTLSSQVAHAGSSIPSHDLSVALNAAGNLIAVWPEDSTTIGAQQIKASLGAGLAIQAPSPPLAFPLVQPPIAIPFEPLYISSSMSALPPKVEAASVEAAPEPVPVLIASQQGPNHLPATPHPAPVTFPTPQECVPELLRGRTPPLPPATPTLVPPTSGIVYGIQVVHRFPGHADRINILKWTAPENVTYYRIYRGSFSSLIGAANQPYFEDHQRVPGQKETYFVTAVDQDGHESSPITIIVLPQVKR